MSTTGGQTQITLFHDTTDGLGATKPFTQTYNIENSRSPIVFMGTIAAARGPEVLKNASDLLVIKEDGEIICFDGDNLQERWISPTSALGRDRANPVKNPKVEFANLTKAFAASQGILKGRQDVFALFPQEISEDGFNPDILVIVTKSGGEIPIRTLHIVALPRRSAVHLGGLKHSIEPLLTANLPIQSPMQTPSPFNIKTSFSVQVSTGVLQQLSGNVLTIFDLGDTLPKEQSHLTFTDAQSFLRLSSTSIMVSSHTSISVYNPKFQSILATTPLETTTSDSLKRKRESLGEENGGIGHSCNLVAYFPKLGTAVAIRDNDLVAVQIEGQHDHQGRARAIGLLIDSLGCSMRERILPGRTPSKPGDVGLSTMDSYLSTSIWNPDDSLGSQGKLIEESVSEGNTAEFDELMAKKLELTWATEVTEVADTAESNNVSKEAPNGTLPDTARDPSDIDRHCVLYALSKIFTWSEVGAGDYRLSVSFYPPNVFMWLIKTGNMTITNIESALRENIRAAHVRSIPAGELVNALLEIDPDMDLLLALLAKNFLGAAELLHAIRKLMDSLELFGENPSTKQGLLTNGDVSELANGDVEEVERLEGEMEGGEEVERLEEEMEVEEEVERLEAEMERAEYQLGPGSDIRGQALTLALSKLYTCPTASIVYALQTTFSSQELVSLIYLLRFELARGAWTSRYLDVDQSDIIDDDADIPENAIVLISSLLNNCVDAVGAGGWLSGDARLVAGDPFEAEELIASLKLEVSAALEGIEEAAYLKGLTSEMIRYGDAIANCRPQAREPELETIAGKRRLALRMPVLLPSAAEQDLKVLPLGLKASQRVSRQRVGAGGEIHDRSARDIGRLKSQKVGKYSLERIVV